MDSVDSGPWFPMVFVDKCDGCAKNGKPRCVEFCPNSVFTFQDGKAVVANPANCGSGSSIFHCSACAPLCPKRAISFPTSISSLNSGMERNKDLMRKTTCRICGKQYWTNREKDDCFDCEKVAKP